MIFRRGPILERHHASLLDTLDHLNQAALVSTAGGRPLHATPALGDLLAADPEGEVLRGAMQAALASVRSALEAGRGQERPISGPEAFDVRTSWARYRIRPCVHGPGGGGWETLILVALERISPVPLSEGELRETSGLTRAEARVAGLLARGCGNADIAAELSISPHTARRHTERVMLKMGARSRAEVAGKVYG